MLVANGFESACFRGSLVNVNRLVEEVRRFCVVFDAMKESGIETFIFSGRGVVVE